MITENIQVVYYDVGSPVAFQIFKGLFTNKARMLFFQMSESHVLFAIIDIMHVG